MRQALLVGWDSPEQVGVVAKGQTKAEAETLKANWAELFPEQPMKVMADTAPLCYKARVQARGSTGGRLFQRGDRVPVACQERRGLAATVLQLEKGCASYTVVYDDGRVEQGVDAARVQDLGRYRGRREDAAEVPDIGLQRTMSAVIRTQDQAEHRGRSAVSETPTKIMQDEHDPDKLIIVPGEEKVAAPSKEWDSAERPLELGVGFMLESTGEGGVLGADLTLWQALQKAALALTRP